MGAGLFGAWRARVEYNAWPRAGGWADQPLAMIVHFQVLDLVAGTWRYFRTEKADLGKFSKLQWDLIRWIEDADND